MIETSPDLRRVRARRHGDRALGCASAASRCAKTGRSSSSSACPTRAIAEVAQRIEPGPWVAHTSGATSLSALDPHVRRFGLHPLQTFTHQRGPGAARRRAAPPSSPRRRGAPRRLVARAAARPRAVRSRRRRATALPRRRGDRVELPRHAAPSRLRALRGGRCAGGGARAADAADDRERLRADRPDLARRLGDRRAPPRSDPRRATRARAAVRRPRRGDDSREARANDRRAARRARAEPARDDRRSCRRWAPSTTGHLALLRAARAECDVVVASACSSTPRSSARASDLNGYPRDEAHDVALAEAAGVDVLFAPAAEEIYPPGFQTWVDVEELGAGLEGVHRPGHFRGVATICLKLFNIVRPRRAYFGQKDAQQVAVLRRMRPSTSTSSSSSASLPTVRDADGLALSSRNARLSPDERERALALPRALATQDAADGARERPRSGLDRSTTSRSPTSTPRVLAAAVRVGTTRLIDNVLLEGDTA